MVAKFKKKIQILYYKAQRAVIKDWITFADYKTRSIPINCYISEKPTKLFGRKKQ